MVSVTYRGIRGRLLLGVLAGRSLCYESVCFTVEVEVCFSDVFKGI